MKRIVLDHICLWALEVYIGVAIEIYLHHHVVRRTDVMDGDNDVRARLTDTTSRLSAHIYLRLRLFTCLEYICSWCLWAHCAWNVSPQTDKLETCFLLQESQEAGPLQKCLGSKDSRVGKCIIIAWQRRYGSFGLSALFEFTWPPCPEAVVF